jgi:XrtJ-associated TM-motif-TM protein
MKKTFLFAILALAFTAAMPVHAQSVLTGCTDTPENPTLILAGLSGGAYAVSALRTRLRARRKSDNK